jgi:hypothetical protein
MKLFLIYPANRRLELVQGRAAALARWTALTALLSVSGPACSEETSPAPVDVGQSGKGGQGMAGTASGGSALGGASGATTAGSASGGGGSAGAAGLDGGGNGGTAGSGGSGGSGGSPDDGWVPLFNGMNLDGWTQHGTDQTLFAVSNGEIHAYPTQPDQSEQPQANLMHMTKLGPKYTLHVEYKWGEARFSDRKQTERDAGILFHITGDLSKVWPDSIECQLGSSPVNGSWVTGDLWVLGGPTSAQTKDENGQLHTSNGPFGYSPASAQAELAHGQWNIVEVTVNGDAEAIFKVNDVEVKRVFNMKYNGVPLSEGYVSIQAEFAELFYRNIRYKLED